MATSSKAWEALHGVLSVYKPSGVPIRRILNITQQRLLGALNELRNDELHRSFQKKKREHQVLDYSRHPLVIGKSFVANDVHLNPITPLSQRAGGVCLFAVNDLSIKRRIVSSKWLHTFRIVAELGKATDTGFVDGKVISRSRQPFLREQKVSKAFAAIAGNHQKQAIVLSGLLPQSQECYEMAVKGVLRPNVIKHQLGSKSESDDRHPLVYGLRCISLDRLNCILEFEIQCLDASIFFVLDLIADIGNRLKTDASCRSLRCLRHGLFRAEEALTLNEINIQSVIDNITKNNQLVNEHQHLLPSTEDVETVTLPNLVALDGKRDLSLSSSSIPLLNSNERVTSNSEMVNKEAAVKRDARN